MITISLCMIVKNETEVLEQCLKSVQHICDEIIIVDTGSTDNTKQIASKYTDKIYSFKWIDDFSAARNYAFNLATQQYILWLDADDILLKNDQEKLLTLKSNLSPTTDSVTMNYIISFDEYDRPSFYFRRNRLVKRINHFRWKGAVHEYLEVSGIIKNADIAIVHRKEDKSQVRSKRNINIYENRLSNGEPFTPRDLFYYANELKDHQQFTKAIQYYTKFLDSNAGWIEDRIRAYLYLADIYRKWDNKQDEMNALIHTFALDTPRPEVCCRLADIFQEKQSFHAAIYWYHCAIHPQENQQGFINQAFSTWYPHLSLCKCYFNIGEVEKAIRHNDIVGNMRPNDPHYLYNKDFFQRNYLKVGAKK